MEAVLGPMPQPVLRGLWWKLVFTTGLCFEYSSCIFFMKLSPGRRPDFLYEFKQKLERKQSAAANSVFGVRKARFFFSSIFVVDFALEFSGLILYKVWSWWTGSMATVLWMLLEERGFCWSCHFRTGNSRFSWPETTEAQCIASWAVLWMLRQTCRIHACLASSTRPSPPSSLALPEDEGVLWEFPTEGNFAL